MRLVLGAVLGAEQQQGYALVRQLHNFMLVCTAWREAAATTPLAINLDYMAELPEAAVRWLRRMTIEDLQVNPGGCWGVSTAA